MNKRGIIAFTFAFVVGLSALSINLFAQNQQNYNMNIVESDHYITLSILEMENDNLALAKVYATKAIQANSWNKKAWANYNDIVQRLADSGGLQDFETFIEESAASAAPAAGDGGSKFEGC